MILFITNLIIKFCNAFAIHKAIGKQASITKILLTGIFGIFSQPLSQLVAQIQEEEENSDDSDENYTHYGNHKPRKKHTFRRHSTDITHTTDYTDNDKPAEIYVDTNYKHYNNPVVQEQLTLYNLLCNTPFFDFIVNFSYPSFYSSSFHVIISVS